MPTDAQIEAAAREIWELTIQGVSSEHIAAILLRHLSGEGDGVRPERWRIAVGDPGG